MILQTNLYYLIFFFFFYLGPCLLFGSWLIKMRSWLISSNEISSPFYICPPEKRRMFVVYNKNAAVPGVLAMDCRIPEQFSFPVSRMI